MPTATDKITALHEALAAVDVCGLPTMTKDRSIPRKEQAALARKLFKQLGLRGISVTTPSYSMASSVDVRLPNLSEDAHDRTRWPHHHTAECCQIQGGHNEANRCPACRDESKAGETVEEILARAFPSHDNRSDYQSDHFDFCWSIN